VRVVEEMEKEMKGGRKVLVIVVGRFDVTIIQQHE
jgi:hypothetical protein